MNVSSFVDELNGRLKIVEVYASYWAMLFNDSTFEGTFKHSMILEVNNIENGRNLIWNVGTVFQIGWCSD